jgi:hypothetical protein
LETRTTNANVLGTDCRWTLSKGFWHRGGRWRLCNIKTTYIGQWKRRTDGRFWGQNNIDFIILDDETIVE